MNNDLESPKPWQHDAVQPILSFFEGASMEKNDFISSIGHELRNPLSNIIAQVETLLDGIYGPLENTQKKAVTAIQDSARQLLQLVADVVDLGRLEAGAAPLTETPCMVREKCAGGVSMVAGLAKSRSIEIVTEVQPHDLAVHADANRLQQIIAELLAAAILSMQTGGRLRLSIVHDPSGLQLQTQGVASELAHSHAGQEGMSAYLLGQLGKVKPVGLALLQQLVQLHNGSFAVQKEAGQLVTMSVCLPLSRVSAASPEAPPFVHESHASVETLQPATSHLPTILIADDQPSLLAVTRNYLESLGFHVITARDGNEAVQQACTLHPDLILMDVRMPVVDGLSAIRQIRASTDPKTRDIAIVSLSGHASAADKEKCLAAGATAYLNKPFGVRELDRIIADHIGTGQK